MNNTVSRRDAFYPGYGRGQNEYKPGYGAQQTPRLPPDVIHRDFRLRRDSSDETNFDIVYRVCDAWV